LLVGSLFDSTSAIILIPSDACYLVKKLLRFDFGCFIPIAVFSADNNESAMLGCLYKGAALYLMKPIIKNDVKNLWQLTYRTKIKTAVSGKGSNSFHGGSSEEKASSVTAGNPSSTMGMTDQKGKRKELEEMNNDDEDNNNLTVPKKRKLVWTNELHNRFLQAIRILGIDGKRFLTSCIITFLCCYLFC